MPCYESPLPHEEHHERFLYGALCFMTKEVSEKALSSYPGLAEWRRRHDALDAVPRSEKLSTAISYDSAQGFGGWAGPKYMHDFLEGEEEIDETKSPVAELVESVNHLLNALENEPHFTEPLDALREAVERF